MKPEQVGRTVQWARKRAGMTQHELARAVRMPQPSLARIERGAVIPRTATLIALLAATGFRLAVEPIEEPVDAEPIRRSLARTIPARTRRAIGKRAQKPETTPLRLLRPLRRFSVPFVVVGELAEAAHGSPAEVGGVIEVVHATTEVARERIAIALNDLELTKTDPSGLRLLTETPAGDDYDVLMRNAVRMPIAAGMPVQVASIEDLIRARLARRTPEDQSAAALLRAVADEAAARGAISLPI